MFRFPSPVTLRLEPGQLIALRHGAGARLSVREGSVHLTSRGDAQDHFLHGGQHLDLAGRAGVVIEAGRPTLLCLEQAGRGRTARGLAAVPSWLTRRFTLNSGRVAAR